MSKTTRIIAMVLLAVIAATLVYGSQFVLGKGTPVDSGIGSDVSLPEGSREVVERAIGDLASRLGLSERSVGIVSVEARMWSDASLGCPQPGKMYAQVVTPGFQIRLEAQGKVYDYHTGMGSIVLCDK